MAEPGPHLPYPVENRGMAATAAYWLTPLLAILVSLLLLHRRRRAPVANHRPATHPIIGNLVAFIRNRDRFLDWSSDLLLSAPSRTIEVVGPIGLTRGVCTADPAGVDHLLRSNFPNYVKGRRTTSALHDLLGLGIFNAESHLWFLQRKLASREFTTRSLRSFSASTVRTQIQTRLLPLLRSSPTVDLQDILRRFGFDTICAVAFGADPSALHHDPAFFHAFDDAVEISAARLFSPAPLIWRIKRALNLGSERKLRAAVAAIDDYAMSVIASKEAHELEHHHQQDLLSRFMAAVEEEDTQLGSHFAGESERRRFLRDIVVSFVLAGKDSTSSALTWFFWLLSVNRRCEGRILEELSELGEDEDELLKGLQYLHAAISESLRLYPPVPIDSRVAVADDVLPDGTVVKAGWFTDYSAYAMGRSEAVWGRDCLEFRPERWLDGEEQFVPAEPSRFPVFHAGPRTCLGREMAYVQMKAVAAAVLREFEVEPVVAAGGRAAPPPYELSLTLRMKGGFPVRLKKRRLVE